MLEGKGTSLSVVDDREGKPQKDGNQDVSFVSEKRMFVPSLAVAGFAVTIPAIILTLFTVDIALTFEVPVGIAAQLSSVSSVAQVVFALLMGVFAVRFRHKSLLLIGLLLVIFAAVIGFFGPSLVLIQTVFALLGGGAVMVNIMSLTLIGDFLPLQRKAKAVSYIFAITSFASLIGTPIMGFLTELGSWRLVFIAFVLPIAIVGLALSFLGLPSTSADPKNLTQKQSYISSFRQVFSNKSAVFCLFGGIVSTAGTISFGIFAIAFYRENFLVATDFTVAVMLAVSSVFIIASLMVGRLVNKFGAKNLAVGSLLLSGVFTGTFFLAPNLWVALALNVSQAFFFATGGTAYNCLILDQVPQSRGTILSFNTVCGGIGGAIGAAVGGAILILFSYPAVGFAFAAICFTATAIYHFLTKDPNRN